MFRITRTPDGTRWMYPRRARVHAGATSVVRINICTIGRAVDRSSAHLVLESGDARRLAGGSKWWRPGRVSRLWMTFDILLAVSLSAMPGSTPLRLQIADLRGARTSELTMHVDVQPGYECVGLRRTPHGVRLRLRNRTGSTWRSPSQTLVHEDRPGPGFVMLEAVVAPGAVATFDVPQSEVSSPLRVSTHRVGRLHPPVIAIA
jgi:hypothetical protein